MAVRWLEKKMNTIIRLNRLLVLIFSVLFSCAQVNRPSAHMDQQRESKSVITYPVSGLVTRTMAYCGGAAPGEEMLMEYRKPRPYAGKIFYIREGSTNNTVAKIILQFTTDSAGRFSFQLPQGTYAIIQQEQTIPLRPENYRSNATHRYDMDCLLDWWKQPYYLLQITSEPVQGLLFTFHRRCFIESDLPCIEYTGPRPP